MAPIRQARAAGPKGLTMGELFIVVAMVALAGGWLVWRWTRGPRPSQTGDAGCGCGCSCSCGAGGCAKAGPQQGQAGAK